MAELETLREAHLALQSKYTRAEETLAQLLREKEESKRELEDCKDKIEGLLRENSEKSREHSESLDIVKEVKQGMARVIRSMGQEDEEHPIVELEVRDGDLRVELKGVVEFGKRVGLKLDEFKEKEKKDKRDLEYGLVSLNEENRDVYNLLKIALAEKEAVERSLIRLKENNEQKRGALLQIAGRGLQKVGLSFGFMGANVADECSSETSGDIAAADSDSSESEEEAVSLVVF